MRTRDSRLVKIMRPRGKTCVPIRVILRFRALCAHSLKTTRSSHSAQYRRHQTYSDALKNSFFPQTIGIVCLLLWQMPSPQRSLGHSLFKQKFSQKFLCFFLFFFFLCCCCFLFYQKFQIRTPWCNAHV